MAGTHGGRRRGAGRKKLDEADRRRLALDEFEARLVGHVGAMLANLRRLADGGYERVTDRYAPAYTLTRPVQASDAEGRPLFDSRGRPVIVEVPAFPDLAPDAPVLVSRTIETAEPDRGACIYLIDRLIGRPHTAEVPREARAEVPLPEILERALDRAYGAAP